MERKRKLESGAKELDSCFQRSTSPLTLNGRHEDGVYAVSGAASRPIGGR